VETIKETLTIEIRESGDASYWEANDYRIDRITKGLGSFVREVADRYAKSPEESELMVMTVAKTLFDSFYAAQVSEVLRERLQRDRERQV